MGFVKCVQSRVESVSLSSVPDEQFNKDLGRQLGLSPAKVAKSIISPRERSKDPKVKDASYARGRNSPDEMLFLGISERLQSINERSKSRVWPWAV